MIRNSQTYVAPASRTIGLIGALCLAVGLGGSPAHAAEAPVGLGTAASFAVLAGQSISNTGASVVTGDMGVAPGTSVTGVPPLVLTGGALHVADAVADQAQSDLTTAYNSAAGRSTVTDVTGQDLGGKTFTSGVVSHTSGMQLTGTVTLDAQGDPSAVFIFKAVSTLITAPNATVSLINGASPCNVYWQVGSSTTLDTGTTFVGTVMSLTSATLATGATVQGRVLARNGSVTLDTNVITRPTCANRGVPDPDADAIADDQPEQHPVAHGQSLEQHPSLTLGVARAATTATAAGTGAAATGTAAEAAAGPAATTGRAATAVAAVTGPAAAPAPVAGRAPASTPPWTHPSCLPGTPRPGWAGQRRRSVPRGRPCGSSAAAPSSRSPSAGAGRVPYARADR